MKSNTQVLSEMQRKTVDFTDFEKTTIISFLRQYRDKEPKRCADVIAAFLSALLPINTEPEFIFDML